MNFNTDTYDSLISELFEKHPTVQTNGFGAGAYKPGLDGMRRFDEALGHPWKSFRSIHVAGTNGKGSVSSMLAAALASEGLRVGLYTSPHLSDFRERIKIISARGNVMIPKEDVFRFLTENDTDGLSFFEITTGMAFQWFARQQVDAAVIEAGLGGRLDSTNIITPELTVVASIGLDHCAMLGGTREMIAAEKAGIFKPGVPAVVWGWDEETGPVFESKAGEVRCPLIFADETEIPEAEFDRMLPALDLQGPCQKLNLRTVMTALQATGFGEMTPPRKDALLHTAAITGLRGRWERLQGEPEVICDIGHNSAALKINFERLQASGRPLTIVYGVMADKDLDSIAPLMPSDADYVLVSPATSRSLGVEALRGRLAQLRPDLRTRTAPSVAEGVKTALKTASQIPESLIYIGGSTFVVSEAVELFQTTTL